MSNIKVIDFLKEVESNRQSLIANAQSKGKIIDNNASLTQAVAVNNTIEPTAVPEKIEVRFFDADGTLLQSNYIEYGGSVTPPNNPNYDPDRLTFKRWASAIGEQFDNITHDVDFGALYSIKNGSYHLFCTFNDDTGYTVTLPVYQNKSNTITINWGDDTENNTKTNTGTTNISHTYAKAGSYEIIVSSDTPIDYPSYYYYISSYLLSTSSSSKVFNALTKTYMPFLYSNNFQYTKNVDIAIIENISNLGTIFAPKFIILNTTRTVNTSSVSIISYQTKMLIFDSSFESGELSVSYAYSLDKIIVPQNTICTLNYIGDIIKIIILSNEIYYTGTNLSQLRKTKSLQFLNLQNGSTLPSIIDSFNLEEYIYPDIISEIDGYIARNSKLKQVKIPNNCIVSNGCLYKIYNLETLILYQNFDYSLRISSYQITQSCVIDMLNKVKDNTGLTAKTLSFSADNISMMLLNTYVVLDNDIWVLADSTTPNAMTLVEAFNSKNWTIS